MKGGTSNSMEPNTSPPPITLNSFNSLLSKSDMQKHRRMFKINAKNAFFTKTPREMMMMGGEDGRKGAKASFCIISALN